MDIRQEQDLTHWSTWLQGQEKHGHQTGTGLDSLEHLATGAGKTWTSDRNRTRLTGAPGYRGRKKHGHQTGTGLDSLEHLATGAGKTWTSDRNRTRLTGAPGYRDRKNMDIRQEQDSTHWSTWLQGQEKRGHQTGTGLDSLEHLATGAGKTWTSDRSRTRLTGAPGYRDRKNVDIRQEQGPTHWSTWLQGQEKHGHQTGIGLDSLEHLATGAGKTWTSDRNRTRLTGAPSYRGRKNMDIRQGQDSTHWSTWLQGQEKHGHQTGTGLDSLEHLATGVGKTWTSDRNRT
ncbi:Hypp5673 [Branchiostoma lanceolatum]|uniref:Hypp5673 protein n=1 Tax=Branchiostoma lanceolatum TaxID=7740 RepID=A0A8J9YNM8_BRALA|nr:Hypp5673 [Branchiostoma lanceolatum]